MDKMCAKCKYWLQADKQSVGDCKRFPPQVVIASLYTSAYTAIDQRYMYEYKKLFPQMSCSDYCGEFER